MRRAKPATVKGYLLPNGKGIPMADSLSDDLLQKMDAYWRAANYLSVGQIYLMDNPLLREPLRQEHIKPQIGRAHV